MVVTPMHYFHCQAIILKKIAYSEGDTIVTFLTDTGAKLAAMARGGAVSKRRFAGTLDQFNRLRITYKENVHRDLVVLEEAELLAPMEKIRTDLAKFAAASYFSELVLSFIQEKDAHPRIYSAFHELLEGLEDSDEFRSHLIPLMEHRFLDLFGFKPQLHHCLNCQGPIHAGRMYYFDGMKGGIICEACHPKSTQKTVTGGAVSFKKWEYPLSYTTIQHILSGHGRLPSQWNDMSWNPEHIAQARSALEYFIQLTAGKPFKSLKFMSQIL